MATDIVLCDTTEGVAGLQYFLLRHAPELTVEVTTDAFRGVELAARVRPTVVVTELSMEGLGGPELVKRLRASAPETRVVAWTDADDAGAVADALAAGASGYVLKEEGAEELIRVVRAELGGAEVTLSPRVAHLVGAELAGLRARARELEEQIQDVARRTEEGTVAKADFLSNISHELRTPITVAKGISYVLKNPAVTEHEREEFIDQLTTSLDKLMMMVDELITIAELERGTLELDLARIDLAPLLRHAADEIGRHYPAVSIERDISDVLLAFADPARIGEVVRELLDNACRYSPEGRPVEIGGRALDQGVVVTVTDRGQGMQRDVVAQAFDQPFSTGEATLRKEKAGVGVGLHLARQLILGHGGIMWADPIPSGGTRISFCVPAHEGERVTAPPIELPAAG
ncbi:MAG: response regulator [Actinobacteria bacterium]|nr:response regulator [Actinomycetota bacterium]